MGSIRKNSTCQHQIIVYANEATDGTLEWLKDNRISYTYSGKNTGVCYGFNAPASLAAADYNFGRTADEFSPGMYSDPDFMMKLWHLGTRYFKGVSRSRGYHFLSANTRRVKKNNGNKQFLLKWGTSSSTFFKFYLRIGTPFEGKLAEPKKTFKFRLILIKDKLKRIIAN